LNTKSQLYAIWRKAMPGLEDMIRSSVPGGNIGKPLMIALAALLASGALFRGGGAGQSASTGAQPTSDDGSTGGGLLSGLGGLLSKLQQGGLGSATNSWVGSGQNQRYRLIKSALRSAPASSKPCLSRPASPRTI
jgi:uncharacterized protein YidB (DUF937 family)